ncbi:MAG: penicillin-insensitive murein endopeptidase, partial [Pseudomonadota bacterium]
NLSSISVRRGDQRGVNGNWTPQHMEVIKAAASDKRVDRIFVTAPAKIWMCNNARGNKRWLQKVRPFWGHHYHFHVRLKCPRGSRGCITQTPTVRELSKGGTGCDETLTWWVTDALSPPKKTPTKPKTKKKPVAKKKNARQFTMADLPQACQGVLASK